MLKATDTLSLVSSSQSTDCLTNWSDNSQSDEVKERERKRVKEENVGERMTQRERARRKREKEMKEMIMVKAAFSRSNLSLVRSSQSTDRLTNWCDNSLMR